MLSLGASMASWARRGAAVELLTVLACDPASEAPAGGWDARGGFATEGESARARREEDRQACAVIGASPVWLPYGSVDYDRHGDETEVRDAVLRALDGAELVLVPGFPLTHPDHAWLVRTLVSDLKSDTGRGSYPIGLYGEQPYTRRVGTEPTFPPGSYSSLGRRSSSPSPWGSRPHREVARDPPLRLAAPAPRDATKPAARPPSLRGRFRVDRLGAGLTSTAA